MGEVAGVNMTQFVIPPREALCKICKRPFVENFSMATLHGFQIGKHKICPDCRENMGRASEQVKELVVESKESDRQHEEDDYSEESFP